MKEFRRIIHYWIKRYQRILNFSFFLFTIIKLANMNSSLVRDIEKNTPNDISISIRHTRLVALVRMKRVCYVISCMKDFQYPGCGISWLEKYSYTHIKRELLLVRSRADTSYPISLCTAYREARKTLRWWLILARLIRRQKEKAMLKISQISRLRYRDKREEKYKSLGTLPRLRTNANTREIHINSITNKSWVERKYEKEEISTMSLYS